MQTNQPTEPPQRDRDLAAEKLNAALPAELATEKDYIFAAKAIKTMDGFRATGGLSAIEQVVYKSVKRRIAAYKKQHRTIPISTPAEKKCIACGEVKHIDNYYVDATKSDGHRARCNACHKSIRKAPPLVVNDKLKREECTNCANAEMLRRGLINLLATYNRNMQCGYKRPAPKKAED